MSAFTSDDEVLAYLKSSGMPVSGDWEIVSEDNGEPPMYEAPLRMSGGKEAKGLARVAISGDYAISLIFW